MSTSNAVWSRMKIKMDSVCTAYAEAHFNNKELGFENFQKDVNYSCPASQMMLNERLTLMEALRTIFNSKSVDGKCFFHVLIDTILRKPKVFSRRI